MHMKMMLVEDKEKQQPEEMVRKSIEKVDEDGHVIHHMDDKNNYLDEKGNVEMAAYPIPIRLPLSCPCPFPYPCHWRDRT